MSTVARACRPFLRRRRRFRQQPSPWRGIPPRTFGCSAGQPSAADLEAAAAAVSSRVLDLVRDYTREWRDDASSPSPCRPGAAPRRREESSSSSSVKSAPRKSRTTGSSCEVFCNTALDLGGVGVIGFDYDYTLATYKFALQHLIYDEAKRFLLEKAGYPPQLGDLTFDEDFAARGLIFDRRTGLLLKLTFAQRITPGQAYLGRRPASDAELSGLYGASLHVSSEYMRDHMTWVNDLFSLSEACLLADVVQLALDAGIPFEPFALHQDVREAISYVHKSGVMHGAVAAEPADFLRESPGLRTLLGRFRSAGKQVFLLTNSSFPFVNAGLRYLIGDDWRDLFDVIVTDARKPGFYRRGGAPFRRLDSKASFVRWHQVTASELRTGRVLVGGSVDELCKLAGWEDENVLYFGDHLYADLREPRRARGWYTGAIIRELEDEIEMLSSDEFKLLTARTDAVEALLRDAQASGASAPPGGNDLEVASVKAGEEELLDSLERERMALLRRRASLFNAHFGSIFRAHGHPSAYGFEVYKGCDIYTTRMENLLLYPTTQRFYPQKRDHLPHENVVP